jgi:hypothetical protein
MPHRDVSGASTLHSLSKQLRESSVMERLGRKVKQKDREQDSLSLLILTKARKGRRYFRSKTRLGTPITTEILLGKN